MRSSDEYTRASDAEIEKKTKAILETIDRAYRELRKQEQVGHLSFIHRISLNLEQDKVEEMLVNLTNGYLVTKHSIGTKVPHSKYLYLSGDRRFLCWKSPDKADEKMLELRKLYILAESRDIAQVKKSLTLQNNKENCFILVGETRNL